MQRTFLSLALAATLGLAPTWAMAGDQDQGVAQQIAINLRDSGTMQGYRIAVKFVDGVGLLTGRVANEQQIVEAEEIALQTEGVQQIVNDLKVEPVAPQIRQPRRAMAGHSETRLTSHEELDRTTLTTSRLRERPDAPVRQLAHERQTIRTVAQPTPVDQGTNIQVGEPIPVYSRYGGGVSPAAYDHPHLPRHAWPSYAAYPNYAAVTYPKQYSARAWPYIGPFYPYPQVPLGWRKVTLEWDDGWWMLNFKDH